MCIAKTITCPLCTDDMHYKVTKCKWERLKKTDKYKSKYSAEYNSHIIEFRNAETVQNDVPCRKCCLEMVEANANQEETYQVEPYKQYLQHQAYARLSRQIPIYPVLYPQLQHQQIQQYYPPFYQQPIYQQPPYQQPAYQQQYYPPPANYRQESWQ